tara:strand:+ start:650 stop:829 length:180 start_codon:yes stop_codon:yes gene_type:complete
MKWLLVYVLFNSITGEPLLLGKIYSDFDVCDARQQVVRGKYADIVLIAPCYPIDPKEIM